MNKKERTERKINSYLNNHIWLRYVIDYGTAFIASVISAAIFSFGIVCFLKPGCDGLHDLVSGGSSGAAQLITSALEMIFPNLASSLGEDKANLVFSICYVCVNAPLIIVAFKGIGSRFAIFTCVNVACVFAFSNLFANPVFGDFFINIARFINANGGLLSRALFAGLCTGLSSAIAFKFETSAGGFDILSYYVSLRKSTATGPYIAFINGLIIFLFYLLSGIRGGTEELIIGGTTYTISSWTMSISGILFSLVYIVETILIVDLINIRNKKVQLQIITSNAELPRMLLANVPHGATITKGKGAYSGEERLIIYTIISSGEVKKTIRLIREIDPSSFINVTTLQQVYGKFFIKPVR